MTKVTKEQAFSMIAKWKTDGYDVSTLEAKATDSKAFPVKLYREYENNIAVLKACELDLANIPGNEKEKSRIQLLMKDPMKAKEVRAWVNDIMAAKKQDFFLGVMEENTAVSPENSLEEQIERGFSYLVNETTPTKSFTTFELLLKKGAKGLCVTREFPDKVKKNYNLGNSHILWLSNVEHELAINPVNLGNLYHIIEQFLKNNQDTVILFSGMEYLISQNTYPAILKLIQLLNDQVAVNKSILIVPISSDALEEKHVRMLERELVPIG